MVKVFTPKNWLEPALLISLRFSHHIVLKVGQKLSTESLKKISAFWAFDLNSLFGTRNGLTSQLIFKRQVAMRGLEGFSLARKGYAGLLFSFIDKQSLNTVHS